LRGEQDIERGIALGANAYLAKPFTPDQLRDACARLMSASAASRSSEPPLGGP
jgi:CheY-like chemotaxis protein